MEYEFAYAGDFWNAPRGEFTTTDKWGRGRFMYSQIISGNCSFGNVLTLTSTGLWQQANCANSLLNGKLGLAMDSYTSNASQCQIMEWGVLYMSQWSAIFSGKVGRPVYLDSGVPGSITMGFVGQSGASYTSCYIQCLGYVILPSTASTSPITSCGGKFFFNPVKPVWGVTGT